MQFRSADLIGPCRRSQRILVFVGSVMVPWTAEAEAEAKASSVIAVIDGRLTCGALAKSGDHLTIGGVPIGGFSPALRISSLSRGSPCQSEPRWGNGSPPPVSPFRATKLAQ